LPLLGVSVTAVSVGCAIARGTRRTELGVIQFVTSGQESRLGLPFTDDAGALFAMVFALLLGRGDGSGRRSAARIVPILHAFLEESITRLAFQSLLVRTKRAGRHFLLRIDCKTWPRRQEHNQSGSQKRATRHAEPPEPLKLQIHIKAENWWPKVGTVTIASNRSSLTLRLP